MIDSSEKFQKLKVKVGEVQGQIEAFNKMVEDLRENFLEVITDQSIPLEERWDLFIKAPPSFKNHEGYTPTFTSFPKEVSWCDDFYMERHEVMTTESLIERITEEFKFCKDNIENSKMLKSTGMCLERLPLLKEEILSMNLGSFEYDW